MNKLGFFSYFLLKFPAQQFGSEQARIARNCFPISFSRYKLSYCYTFTFTLPIIHLGYPPKFCTRVSNFQFLMGITVVPRECQNKACVSFFGGKPRCITGNVKVVKINLFWDTRHRPLPRTCFTAHGLHLKH